MLMKRILGAFMFRKEVYAEVERDVEFTNTAWILVAVVSLISQLGQLPAYGFKGIVSWLIASLIKVVFAVGAFALGAFIVSWAGKQFFKAQVDFGEMVRVLGLAYVWNIIGAVGILGFVPVLLCILTPITIVAAVAGFVAWLFAAKEALDLDWLPTIITVVAGWVITFIVTAVAGMIISALGIGVAVVGG